MSDDSRLAVVLRTAQWELDEVAFALPGGQVIDEQRTQLADTLVNLARLLRAPLLGGTTAESAAAPAGHERRRCPEEDGRQVRGTA